MFTGPYKKREAFYKMKKLVNIKLDVSVFLREHFGKANDKMRVLIFVFNA